MPIYAVWPFQVFFMFYLLFRRHPLKGAKFIYVLPYFGFVGLFVFVSVITNPPGFGYEGVISFVFRYINDRTGFYFVFPYFIYDIAILYFGFLALVIHYSQKKKKRAI